MPASASLATPGIPRKVQAAFRRSLSSWFLRNARVLPWRENRSAYRVWVSELMLQQTRVDQAHAYFLAFMERFPDIHALAAASQHDVLKQWEGLGYYARARNLHKTAILLAETRGGHFPDTYEALIALPGIGPYTAAAIASFAFNRDHAVLDGNVMRVLSRVFAIEEDISKSSTRRAMEQRLARLLPPGEAAIFNEGLMELGALICTPRSPACGKCPLANVCLAHTQIGFNPEQFPVKSKKLPIPTIHVAAAVTVNKHGRLLITQRPDDKMLGGLWEFPGGKVQEGETASDAVIRELQEETGLHVSPHAHLLEVRHTYSHFHLRMDVFICSVLAGKASCIGCKDLAWVELDQTPAYAFSRADIKVLEFLRQYPHTLSSFAPR